MVWGDLFLFRSCLMTFNGFSCDDLAFGVFCLDVQWFCAMSMFF